MATEYEVFALHYASLATSRAETFHRYGIYGEPDAEFELDYFYWVLRGEDSVTLVDTGFDGQVGTRRGRCVHTEPLAALSTLSITPSDVSEVIVTHGHYDHIGNLGAFPDAIVTIQRREFEFWTSTEAERFQFAQLAEPDELDALRRAESEGRVRLIDGEVEIRPGISCRLVGGHCPGQQITVVNGSQQRVVLASDALHLYEVLEKDRPGAIFSNLIDVYRALDTLAELERSGAAIVAGHDRRVFERFDRVDGDPAGIALRLG